MEMEDWIKPREKLLFSWMKNDINHNPTVYLLWHKKKIMQASKIILQDHVKHFLFGKVHRMFIWA